MLGLFPLNQAWCLVRIESVAHTNRPVEHSAAEWHVAPSQVEQGPRSIPHIAGVCIFLTASPPKDLCRVSSLEDGLR